MSSWQKRTRLSHDLSGHAGSLGEVCNVCAAARTLLPLLSQLWPVEKMRRLQVRVLLWASLPED